MEQKKESYFTLRMLSKPIYFMGLPPYYLVGLIFVVLFASVFFFIKKGPISLLVIVPLATALITLLGRLSKEQKKGCPDVLASFFVRLATKKRYSDQSFVLKFLKNETRRLG